MNAETIAGALGLRRSGQGQWHGRCPACGYKSGFTVTDRRDGLPLIYCLTGGCTFADLTAALRKLGVWPEWQGDGEHRPGTEAEPDGTAMALAIWRRSYPAAEPGGSYSSAVVVGTYLRKARGYRGPLPSVLRFAMGRHKQTGKQQHPMMVAPVIVGDELVAVLRTYLRPDGLDKADLAPQKASLGPTEGGAIRLFPAGRVLVIGEGIENALTVGHALGLPAWSAIAAGNMPNIALPDIVREVVIAADRDEHGLGERKAREAAWRWHAEGRRVRIILPPPGAGDWNDMARVK